MYFQYGEAETAYLSARDERMAAVIAQAGHIEREVDTDLFSAVVHHIVGQQISTKAQATIWKRMRDEFGVVAKGGRPNGSLSQWSVTSFGFGRNFAGFGKRLCAYSKKSLWCGARRDGWSRPLPLGAPRPMIFK